MGPKKNTWNVLVTTSDLSGAGTDANVSICLYGKKGKTEETPLDNKDDNFEKGSVDHFKFSLNDVGTPYKLRVYHDDAGRAPGWHIDKIEMENMKSAERYVFECNRWLATDEDDHAIEREMPAKGSNIKNPLSLDMYVVQVFTGSKSMAGTDANVYINLFGERGDTGVRGLRKSQNMNKFEKGQMDEFELEAVSVLKLTKIRIGHGGKGIGAGWFLDKVVVKQVGTNKYDQEFVCQRWLAEDMDDGLIEREITASGAQMLSNQQNLRKIKLLSSEVRNLMDELSNHVGEIAENDQDQQQLKAQIEELKKEKKSDLKNTLDTLTSEFSTLQTETAKHGHLNEEVDILNTLNKELNNQIESIKQEMDTLIAEKDELVTKNLELSKGEIQLTQEVQELKSELKNKNEMSDQKNQLLETQTLLDTRTLELEQASSDTERLSKENKDLPNRLEALQNDLENIKTESQGQAKQETTKTIGAKAKRAESDTTKTIGAEAKRAKSDILGLQMIPEKGTKLKKRIARFERRKKASQGAAQT